MTPEQILEQAYAEVAVMPPHVLPTQAWTTGHPSTLPHGTVRDDITSYALADFPREACGFLLSTGAVVHCTNVADDPYNGFLIDQVEADAWWATELVVGVWHSHATGAAVPSDRDSAMAVPGIAHVIYSVEDEDLATYQPRDGALHLVSMEGPE